MRVSGEPSEQFDAVVRAADALLAILHESDERSLAQAKSFVRVG
jgi:hypothetical protein